MSGYPTKNPCPVSIHAPVKGRPHLFVKPVDAGLVSIHAPVKGRPIL